MKTKMTIVGNYNLGNEMVQLVLREESGGEFYVCPGDIHYARIRIGAEASCWHEIMGRLQHEALEFVLTKLRCRYASFQDFAGDSGAYLFVCNHVQFGEACARVAYFLADCLPDLKAAWKKWRKP